MIIATTFFQTEDEHKNVMFERLFNLWFKTTCEHIDAEDTVIILTDTMPECQTSGAITMMVDHLSVSNAIRDRDEVNAAPAGHGADPITFDRKGALLAFALPIMSEPVLYLDTDAFLRTNPHSHVPLGHSEPFWMPPEALVDSVSVPWDSTRAPHLSAGIMWFPRPGLFKDIAAAYWAAFHELWRTEPRHWLLEQRAWSLAHARMGGGQLTREWNWLPHRPGYGSNDDAIVVHHHGPAKWAWMDSLN